MNEHPRRAVVLVTGGGRGIGRAHCLELARQGAAVVVNDPGVGRDGTGGASRPAADVVAEIEAAGGKAVAHTGSVSAWDDVADMVSTAVSTFGTLTGVVNNAGILRDSMVAGASEADWDAVIAVHLKGTFAVTRHACDYWRAQFKAGNPIDAHIVNTVSGAGLWGNVGQSAYGAAKAAIANLTVVTAMEAQRYGVVVNAISPLAMSRMTADVFGVRRRGSRAGSRPQLRGGGLAAVARVFLADRTDPPHQRRPVTRIEGFTESLSATTPKTVSPDILGDRTSGQLALGHTPRGLAGPLPRD